MSDDDRVHLNGVSGVTGDYLVTPIELDRAATIVRDPEVRDEARDGKLASWLKQAWFRATMPHLGLPLDVDPARVEQAGWAVVFLADEEVEVRRALKPLIEHRRAQVGAERHKVLEYREGESWSGWLARNGVAAGSVVPWKVPYYLLFVGDPRRIPLDLCHQLDVEYGLGLLHLDSPADYQRYAGSVVDYEAGSAPPGGREAVFFAPRHAFDRATELSADLLVTPLVAGTAGGAGAPAEEPVAERWGFRTREIRGDAATKEALGAVFQGNGAAPALLFSASHGVGWPSGHERQMRDQGALLCQDWPGVGRIGPEHYFAATDLEDDARVSGMISFNFACFGAGTPERDRFYHEPGRAPAAIAPYPFLASLPKRLLAHPAGGALACIGHVDRAWGCSIRTPVAGPQILPFRNAIGRILRGEPVGYAMKDFNERYAMLASALSGTLEKIGFGQPVSDRELVANWLERNDAAGYLVIGDPAARLRVDDI